MKSRDLWILAWRGLIRRPVRAALTTAGLAVAVASMVLFLSLGEGVRRVFTQEVGSIGPDLQVSLNGFAQGLLPAPNLEASTADDLRALTEELGFAQITPVVTNLRQALDPKQSAVFYGLPAESGIQALFSGVQAAQGRLLRPADEGQPVAVLGARIAQNLGLKLGSSLRLNRQASVRVIGIIRPENSLTDTFIFLPIGTLQAALGAQGKVSLVAIKLLRRASAGRTADILSGRLKLEVQTQSDFVGFVDRALKISDAARLGISLIAVLVGGLAVANTVMMGVFERMREFATLRAVGARPAFVRALVLAESVLLALVGGAVGVLLGWAGTGGVNLYTQNLAGIDAAALTPRLLGLAFGISLVLGLAAGLLPARAAGKVQIVSALGRA
ncbi:ABC transporter permease [Deinococcus aquatilis]|uniref:ABC transporter permease n=1 Tax=Deinococcus aquatilis TaxID=519440 RepID=UPI0003680759|nr:ABC transporter permease [Deinococcus aquatilis]